MAACVRRALVPHDRLGDLHADGEHGVERDHRLLEDHGDLGAAHLAQGRLVHRGDLVPGNADPPLDAGARRRQQAHQRAQGHALARARLAQDAEHLARFQARS